MGRLLTLFLLMFNTIFALNIPQTSYSTITQVNGNAITLQNSLGANGTSGVIVRNVGGRDYILAYIKQVSPNKAVIIDSDPIDGNPLANIKPIAKVGDRVIGGFLYSKVMILAPNRDDFNALQSSFGINSINPDYFLAYLKGSSPSSSDYKKFAKLMGIGLFLIAKNGILTLYDPISQEVIAKEAYKSKSKINITPFYTNFK